MGVGNVFDCMRAADGAEDDPTGGVDSGCHGER
jgi:hypothetical protein